MQTLKGYEQHSYSSLAERLDYLISRQTLTEWIQRGIIRPAQITRQKKNTHLLFHKNKLDQLYKLLREAQEEHASKIKGLKHVTLQQRVESGQRNSERIVRANERNRREGKPEQREPDPATNPRDAVGMTSLTLNPSLAKNYVRVFGGFGKWKT